MVMRFVLSVPARLRNTVLLHCFVLFMERSRNVAIRVVMRVVMPTMDFQGIRSSGIIISHKEVHTLLG